jgi:hypothetical protein
MVTTLCYSLPGIKKVVFMSDNSFPSISSFVIRFIQEAPAAEQTPLSYRGFIRHIQTDCEISFTRWEDATAFIQQYVPTLMGANDDQSPASRK